MRTAHLKEEDRAGLWSRLRWPILPILLCGLGLGLWEAATITRDNLLYPIGSGHWLLLVVTSVFYAAIAFAATLVAAGAVRWLGAPRASVVAAGPWFLLVICVVSIFRSAASSSARSLAGTLMTLGLVCLAILLLVAVIRRDKLRPGSARRFALMVGLSAVAVGLLAVGTIVVPRAFNNNADDEPGTHQVEVGSHDTGLRVLLIGLDGVTWKVVDPLVQAGSLPVLSSLLQPGASADLETILPTFSPIIWTSIATGKAADKHGIYDHTRTRMPFGLPTSAVASQRLETATKASKLAVRLANRYLEPTNISNLSGDIQALRLWDILDDQELPTLALSWYISYPVKSRFGIHVSDHLARGKLTSETDHGLASPAVLPQLLPEVVYPDEEDRDLLFDLLDTEGLDEASRKTFQDDHARWFRSIWRPLARDLSTLGFARRVFPRLPDWRLAAVFYKSVDGVHHLNWRHRDLPSGDLQSYPERRFRSSVDRLYEFSDHLVAETLALSGQVPGMETVVIVVSDHGWDDALREHDMAPDGVFLMSGGPTLAGGPRGRLHVYDIAPTILALLGLPVPRDMDGRVATEMVDPAFWAAHPIQYIPTYESTAGLKPDGVELELDDDDLEQLKALGYLE